MNNRRTPHQVVVGLSDTTGRWTVHRLLLRDGWTVEDLETSCGWGTLRLLADATYLGVGDDLAPEHLCQYCYPGEGTA